MLYSTYPSYYNTTGGESNVPESIKTILISIDCPGGGKPGLFGWNAVEPPPEPAQPQETEAPQASSAQEFFTEEFDGDYSNWSQTVELNASDGNPSEADIYVEDGRLVFDLGKNLIGYVFYDPSSESRHKRQ